jgi:hypothetical protein
MLGAGLISLVACNKKPTEAPQTNTNPMAMAKGSGGNNNTSNIGLIQSFLSGGASRLAATRKDSMLVVLSSTAPAAGYILTFTSSDPAVQPPASITMAAGTNSKFVVLNSTAVSTARNVTITVSVGGQSKSATIKLYPLTASIPAPSLQSPGSNSKFDFHRQVIFDWSDLNDAYYYEIQVSSTTTFAVLNFSSGPLVSTTVGDYFDGSGVRYWRVRGVDASGNGGSWSAVRSFEVKPQ